MRAKASLCHCSRRSVTLCKGGERSTNICSELFELRASPSCATVARGLLQGQEPKKASHIARFNFLSTSTFSYSHIRHSALPSRLACGCMYKCLGIAFSAF